MNIIIGCTVVIDAVYYLKKSYDLRRCRTINYASEPVLLNKWQELYF